MGLFGDFDLESMGFYPEPGALDIIPAVASPPMATFIFLFIMTLLGLVALNALIALLADSYEKVQDRRAVEQMLKRIDLIIELMVVLPQTYRESIEASTRWVHVLCPDGMVDQLNEQYVHEAWNGWVAEVKKTVRNDIRGLSLHINNMEQRLEIKLNQLGARLGERESGGSGSETRGLPKTSKWNNLILQQKEATAFGGAQAINKGPLVRPGLTLQTERSQSQAYPSDGAGSRALPPVTEPNAPQAQATNVPSRIRDVL